LFISLLHERVNGVLVNPELFSVGVKPNECWEFSMVFDFVVHLVALLWRIEKTIKVNLDEVGVLNDGWSHRHCQVEWSGEIHH